MIFTIPNLISFTRILAVPVFLWLLLGPDNYAAAGWLLMGIGATDWIDGFLARLLDQVSDLGKMLDPVADRLAIVAALIGGWIAGVVPWWVALALLLREVVVGLMALYLQMKAGVQVEVRWNGKSATWAVYGAVVSFYIYAGSGYLFFHWWSWLYAITGLFLYYVVTFQYVGDTRRLLALHASPVSSEGASEENG